MGRAVKAKWLLQSTFTCYNEQNVRGPGHFTVDEDATDPASLSAVPPPGTWPRSKPGLEQKVRSMFHLLGIFNFTCFTHIAGSVQLDRLRSGW